ncbi:hypothetical protein HCG99_11095 [Enterobacter ludwigii]|uniref:hypothetical protein n=1 Tax=Enterobacter cloacae complex TaxID=354276 RepID=UPI001BDFDF6E|nr:MULTISPECIES: hypothetical protein [Enterobacter cloacae complex]MBT2076920.1 hypothetical protein [Enterobacter hormaechei subsp. xiangfangensis]MBW4216244.1 hypothetical protein [Enterobacter cloacae subsp. cloacae]MBX9044319.1 hypothetical protein [Enterobacter ludwigii]MBX9081375.1 hypothetical protein [Enterobacter ludwigii]MEB8025562.1 hypothetical protein [Enterobacter hormaechei]
MANNNRQSMIFEITGDESGLQRSLKNAANDIGNFGDQAGGVFGGINTGLSTTSKAMSGFAGAVGVAGIAIAATMAKVQEQSEKAFEVFQAASLSQSGILQIQQAANMFAAVGLTMDNVADQIKDSKDKLGDAITNNAGSMLTDVIQPLKLNMFELQKAAENGEDIIAKIYYQAKQMGFSQSQIVNMMETVANDASKRMTIYREFNSEQEYQNSLANESIQLTAEQSRQFEEYRAATNNLSRAWDTWKNSTLAPIAQNLAEILDLMTKIINSKPVNAAAAAVSKEGIQATQQYQQQFQQQILKNSSIYGTQIVTDQQKQQEENNKTFANLLANLDAAHNLLDKQKEEYNKGSDRSVIDTALKPYLSAKQKTQAQIDTLDATHAQLRATIKDSLVRAYKGDQAAMNADLAKLDEGYKANREKLVKSLTADEDKAREDKAKKDEAAAKKAQAAQDKLNEQTKRAKALLEQTLSQIGTNEAQIRITRFNYEQDQIEKRIREAGKLAGSTESEITDMLSKQYESRKTKYKDMVDQMLSETNRLKQAQNIAAIANDPNATADAKARAAAAGTTWMNDTVSQGLGYKNPLDFSPDPVQNQNINTEEQENKDGAKALYDAKVLGFQEYQDQLTAIQANADMKRGRLTADALTSTLGMWQTGAGNVADIMAGVFGESSAAAKAAFAVSKGIAIAQAVINIQQGISEAIKLGWPMGIAAGLQVAAQGASIVRTIKGTAIQGQAHDGWDSLPSTGTYNLEKGERVVGKSLNQDLTKYLSNQDGSKSGDIKIDAPLIINSNGQISDSDFQKMCDKHADTIVQATRKSQKNNV